MSSLWRSPFEVWWLLRPTGALRWLPGDTSSVVALMLMPSGQENCGAGRNGEPEVHGGQCERHDQRALYDAPRREREPVPREVRQPEGDGCDPGDRAEKPWTHGPRDVEDHSITAGGGPHVAAEL